MVISRRSFLQQTVALAATTKPAAATQHVVLLGDSIFDNGAYTGGKPDVLAQLLRVLPQGWTASLLARDGATTAGLPAQLARLPSTATHLALSIGGNDALQRQGLLQARAGSVAEAVNLLGDAVGQFEAAYRKAVDACVAHRLPLVICTIYNGNFPDAGYRKLVRSALALFNDAIIRTAIEYKLKAIDLRSVCARPEDYANPIEPSSDGAAKIARAITAVVTGSVEGKGALLVGGVS
jgi:lysophospholipase L1-like esterase